MRVLYFMVDFLLGMFGVTIFILGLKFALMDTKTGKEIDSIFFKLLSRGRKEDEQAESEVE